MVMQVLAGIACLLAAVLQFAVYRDPTKPDTYLQRMARRITMGAMLIAALYSLHAASEHATPSALYLALLLFAMGQSLFAFSNLLPHLEKEHPWTSRLNSSQ